MAEIQDPNTASKGYDVTLPDGTVKHFDTKAEAEAYLESVGSGTISASGETTTPEQFCAEEQRVSNHTCNSLHPALALDCQGNQNIVWHDNRSGNFEIYFRAYPSKLSDAEIAESFSTPGTGASRPTNLNCPVGFSGYRLLSELCKEVEDQAAALGGIRRVATNLAVNTFSMAIYLTDNAADFVAMGISAGASLTVDTGVNMGKGTNVKAVISAKVLELTYSPSLKNDENFVYYLDNRLTKKESCEVRITCTKTASLYPDIVSDCSCRSHVVWHDNKTGADHLYYSQIGYGKEFQKKCSPATGSTPGSTTNSSSGTISIGNGGYPKVTTYTPGTYFFSYKNNIDIYGAYARTGTEGQRVSYGNTNAPPTEGRGLHTIFRDSYSYSGQWVGLSKYYDRTEWETLVDANSFVPPIEITAKTPIADIGDFGSTQEFQRLAFMVMTPPDLGIQMESLTLPFVPKCAPSAAFSPRAASEISDDIVEAPKRPLPPTYIDPIDITALMTSPYATVDSSQPNRYTIEGDESGTIYTNNYISDARGQINQLIFARQEDGSQYKFILSTRKCGDGPCAVRPSRTADASDASSKMYSIMLEVWRGPDYRVDSGYVNSDENQAEKVFEKKFYLSPGDDMTTIAFAPSELILNRGSIYYFVPIPSDGLDFLIRGISGGNVVWTTDGTPTFAQYDTAFTMPPHDGLNAPISFVGYLADSPRTDTEAPPQRLTDELPAGTVTEYPNSFNVDPGIGAQILIPFCKLNRSQGLSYNTTKKQLIASANDPTGLPFTLESIDGNAAKAPYIVGFSGYQSPPGALGEVNVCTIQKSSGGFTEGETYYGNGYTGQIAKVAVDGSIAQHTWTTVPDNSPFDTGYVGGGAITVPTRPGSLDLCHDETGLFQNRLVVVSVTGKIFLVSSDGTSTLLAEIPPPQLYVTWDYYHHSKLSRGSLPIDLANDEWLKGVIVLPNDTVRYGPWAGKIVVGVKRQSLVYTITPTGAVQSFNIGITVEDIKRISSTDLYVVSVNDNNLYRVRAKDLELYRNDLVISQQETVTLGTQTNYYRWRGGRRATQWSPIIVRNVSGQLWNMHWSEKRQKFIALKMASLPSSGLDDMAFADLGCKDPPCNISTPEEPETPSTPGSPGVTPCDGEAKISDPIRLTSSVGNNQNPALGISPTQNLWLVWHSTRNGTEEIYAAKYFGKCSVWNSSATGGSDLRVTNFASDGQQRRAKFPRVAVDRAGNAHIVFQLTDENDNSQIYYTKSNTKDEFTVPVRITDSPADAMMPDIVLAYDSSDRIMLTVVWHDNRFGNWEIMSATSVEGSWRSSAFGGVDMRITASKADSMFPRINADKDSNLRLVFHSNRGGKYDIYMATYSSLAQSWSSSANRGTDLKISTGPANSMFPDVGTDGTGGVAITWQDDRHQAENPDMHEEIYATYCAKMGHAGRPHFSALVTNVEQKMDFKWDFVDCKSGDVIDSTNTENVCLKIKGTNATFWRAINEKGQYSEWSPFKPSVDLDTTIVPWTLSCGNGTKEVCVQIQDQDVVSFPICRQIVLAKPPQSYRVELFSDEAMKDPLPSCMDRQAATEGNVYVKITTPKKILTLPTFDVIQRGLASVYNQETEAIVMNDDGTFKVIDPKDVVSQVKDGQLSIQGYQTFRGMFTIKRQDDLYHVDGLARIIVKSGEPCITRPGSNASTTAAIETDQIIYPDGSDHSPGWSAAGGTATWTSQLSSVPASCATLGLSLTPDVNDVPFNLTLGGVAQPFTSGIFAGGDVTVTLRIARRTIPSWLSSFATRTLTVKLINNFLLPGQSVLGQTTVSAADLEEVELDVISGAIDPPTVAGDIVPVDVTITGVPAIAAGASLAIEVKDEGYANLVNEYGANAKMFVLAVGDTVPLGASPYYVEEF